MAPLDNTHNMIGMEFYIFQNEYVEKMLKIPCFSKVMIYNSVYEVYIHDYTTGYGQTNMNNFCFSSASYVNTNKMIGMDLYFFKNKNVEKTLKIPCFSKVMIYNSVYEV